MFTWYKRLRVVIVALFVAVPLIKWLFETGLLDGLTPFTAVACVGIVGVLLVFSALGWLGADVLWAGVKRLGTLGWWIVAGAFRSAKKMAGYEVKEHRSTAEQDFWRKYDR